MCAQTGYVYPTATAGNVGNVATGCEANYAMGSSLCTPCGAVMASASDLADGGYTGLTRAGPVTFSGTPAPCITIGTDETGCSAGWVQNAAGTNYAGSARCAKCSHGTSTETLFGVFSTWGTCSEPGYTFAAATAGDFTTGNQATGCADLYVQTVGNVQDDAYPVVNTCSRCMAAEIGRASCRERV